MTDSSDETQQRADGLQHGFRVALSASRRVGGAGPDALRRPDARVQGVQRVASRAVAKALESAVVESLFSDCPEAFLDGLLQAQRTLTDTDNPVTKIAYVVQRRGEGGRR